MRSTSKAYEGRQLTAKRAARDHGRRDAHVPIAQLDRALDCGSKGRRFESSWARKIPGTVLVGSGTSMCFADLDPSWVSERCESGRIGRSRKPLSRLRLRGFESHSLRKGDQLPPDRGTVSRAWKPDEHRTSVGLGEMTEWSKVHAWKACVLVRVPWVRIPLSPYNPFGVDTQAMRYGLLPNPVRTGREQR